MDWHVVMYASWALCLLLLGATAYSFATLRRSEVRIGELEREASVAQERLAEAAKKIEASKSMDVALRSEVERRAAAEELGRRIPTLELELTATEQRVETLIASERELASRVSGLTAELSAAQAQLDERNRSMLEVSGERDVLRTQLGEQTACVSEIRERIGRTESELGAVVEQAQRAENSLRTISSERDQLRSVLEDIRRQLAEQTVSMEGERTAAADREQFLRIAQEQLSDRFRTLAGQILEQQSTKFSATNQESLAALLGPLKDRLAEFDQKVTNVYDKESRERVSLQQEIRMLSELHTRMSKETENLTRALKGSGKTQGTWGELVLDRLLAGSGLREGSEYVVQQSLVDEEGHRLQPDVVVNLPDQKYLVVDSKVSLTAYERFCCSENDEERDRCLREHLDSLRRHIRSLASKNYQTLYGIRSPDFVLMFVAVESAYMLGMQEDSDLYQAALKQNVLVVCPSTLIATLKLVESIWRYEHQNLHTQELARLAGQLYDKFVGFVSDMNEVNKKLAGATEAHEEAYKKLTTGRGNLVKTAERVRGLGVRPSKSLATSLVELATDTDDGGSIDLQLTTQEAQSDMSA